MKTQTLILSMVSIGIEGEELKSALESLKREGAIVFYRIRESTLKLAIDPVRAELIKETFVSPLPISIPCPRRKSEFS